MRKVILALAIIITLHGISLADNSLRIKELSDDTDKLSAQIQQAQNFIQQAQVKIIGNNAVIEELRRQDTPKETLKE